jgi:hypothetical protein
MTTTQKSDLTQVIVKGDEIVVIRRIEHDAKIEVRTSTLAALGPKWAIKNNLFVVKEVLLGYEESKDDKKEEPATRQKTGPNFSEKIDLSEQIFPVALDFRPGESKDEYVQRAFADLVPTLEKMYAERVAAHEDVEIELKADHNTPALVPTTPIPTTPLPATAEPTEEESAFGAELTESTLFPSSPLPARAESPAKVKLPKRPAWLKFHDPDF